YCAALGLVYFLRGRGLGRLASYGAGLLLAFSGYWLTLFSAGHLGWFQWMTYGVFAFGLADRALAGGRLRHWILLGAVLAWGSFYQPDLWLLFTVFTFAYFVFALVREKNGDGFWRRFASGSAAALAVFLAIGMPSFRNALSEDLAGRDRQIESGQTLGGAVPADDARWIFVTNWSLPPAETLELLVPRLNGDTSCPFTLALGRRGGRDVKPYTGALGRPLGAKSGNWRQHSLYAGLVTCVLAAIGLAAGFRRREVAFFAVCAFVFWLFSLGRNCETVYRIVYALPFGDYLRAPVKWLHLAEFCLAVLAAYGIEAASSLKGAKFMAPALALAVLAGAADLARVDRLYCAPQDVKCEYTFVPRAQALAANAKIAGSVGDYACVAVPRARPERGTPYAGGFTAKTAMFALSALATLFALALAAAGLFRGGRR
ncbi:MAG: hypothetical protein ILO34_01040, partial [Kiritimatiellae bacterium]|nr:hypothetical protein [Kiritimatiellia bacterium]